MTTFRASVVAIICAVILNTSGASILAATPRRAAPPRTAPTRSSLSGTSPGRGTYSVVKVGDKTKFEIQVLRRSEVIDLKKKLDDEYKKATKDYLVAKKEAAKNKTAAPKRPVRCLALVMQAGFKTSEEALDWKKRNDPVVGSPSESSSEKQSVEVKKKDTGVKEKENEKKEVAKEKRKEKESVAKEKEKEGDARKKG
jgi:hypothetical protein